MRNYFITNSLKLIKKSNPSYDDEKMEILEYGLTIIYILITKTTVIFTIAYFLGLFKELAIFMIIYTLVKKYSFGVHAPSSISCLIASAIIFLTATYVAKTYVLPMGFKTIFGLFGVVYISKYSPADTEKKPIINPRLRMKLKLLSTFISILIFMCSLFVENIFISNSCTLALLIQCMVISPLTYKLLKQQYDNYKYYQQ